MNTAERKTARRDGNRSSTSVPEVRMDGNKLATIPESGVVDERILAIGDEDITSRLRVAFASLTQVKQEVLRLRLGLEGPVLTRIEVAGQLGVQVERIRILEEEAIDHMKLMLLSD